MTYWDNTGDIVALIGAANTFMKNKNVESKPLVWIVWKQVERYYNNFLLSDSLDLISVLLFLKTFSREVCLLSQKGMSCELVCHKAFLNCVDEKHYWIIKNCIL